jgi:hypothetical protein
VGPRADPLGVAGLNRSRHIGHLLGPARDEVADQRRELGQVTGRDEVLVEVRERLLVEQRRDSELGGVGLGAHTVSFGSAAASPQRVRSVLTRF